MLPVFHHNATDILTLACLTGIVPYAFKDPASAALKHGAEMAGIARWLRAAGELDRPSVCFAAPSTLACRTICCSKRCGISERSSASWASSRSPSGPIWRSAKNPFRVRALEELAKHYEHREKNFARALDMTRQALNHEDSAALRKRESRLTRRLKI